MHVSVEVAEMIDEVFSLAKDRRFAYVTPELVLHVVCKNEAFAQAFENCGGRIQELDGHLQAYIEEYMAPDSKDGDIAPQLSQGAGKLLAYAWESAQGSGKYMVELPHIIHAMYALEESYAVYYMRVQGVEHAELLQQMAVLWEENACAESRLEGTAEKGGGNTEDNSREEEAAGAQKRFWKQFAVCLNDELDGRNPLIGRKDELERTMQILCRKEKNNPLHIGEPGVGKTAIVYGFAKLLNENQVPEPLLGAKIYSLDLGSLLAGTQYRGDFEKRLKNVMDSLSHEEKPIIYIDEIHNIWRKL